MPIRAFALYRPDSLLLLWIPASFLSSLSFFFTSSEHYQGHQLQMMKAKEIVRRFQIRKSSEDNETLRSDRFHQLKRVPLFLRICSVLSVVGQLIYERTGSMSIYLQYSYYIPSTQA